MLAQSVQKPLETISAMISLALWTLFCDLLFASGKHYRPADHIASVMFSDRFRASMTL